MSDIESSINHHELDKFAEHAPFWWDTEGPLKTLHDINTSRLDFIRQYGCLSEAKVLDVGCGGGILSESMAKIGAKVTGIDAEAKAIEAACEHAETSKLSIEYHCSTVEDYNKHDFDVVTCMEMLEHVQNPGFILEHCKRLLQPGGLLFLSTISRTLKAYASAIIAAEYVLRLLPRQTHDYEKFIKPSELLAITRSLGFQLLDMKGMSYNPFTRKASLSNNVQVNYLLALRLGGQDL